MLMTRRKRKEQKVAIYLNNKLIPQVHRLKYVGKILLENLI